MRAYWVALSAVSVACAIAACGGRTLTAGPEAGAGGDDGMGGAGGSDDTASSVSSTSAGGDTTTVTATVTGSTSGSGAGGMPPTPIDCITCIADNCPDAVGCFTDPQCIQGVVCSVSQCLEGGQPDIPCVIDCFNGDIGKAFEAIQALTCVFQSCAAECGDLLPFPGP
jgi:hypothetical protein